MAEIKLMGKRDSEPDFTDNTRTLTDDDYNRVAYWAAVKFFPNGVVTPATPAVAAVLDNDGNVVTPEVPATEATTRAPTGAEVFHALTDDVYANIKREAEAWYLQKAEELARQSVQPIVLNPPE